MMTITEVIQAVGRESIRTQEQVSDELSTSEIQQFVNALIKKAMLTNWWSGNGLRLLSHYFPNETPQFTDLCHAKIEQALAEEILELKHEECILVLDDLMQHYHGHEQRPISLLEHLIHQRPSRCTATAALRLVKVHPIKARLAIQKSISSGHFKGSVAKWVFAVWFKSFDNGGLTAGKTSAIDTLSVNLTNYTPAVNDLARATFLQLAKRLQSQPDEITKLAEAAPDAAVAIDLLATLQQQRTPCLLSYQKLSKRSQDSIIAWILNNIRGQNFPHDQLKFAGAVCYEMAVAVVEYQIEIYPGYFEKFGRPEIGEWTRQKLTHLDLGRNESRQDN